MSNTASVEYNKSDIIQVKGIYTRKKLGFSGCVNSTFSCFYSLSQRVDMIYCQYQEWISWFYYQTVGSNSQASMLKVHSMLHFSFVLLTYVLQTDCKMGQNITIKQTQSESLLHVFIRCWFCVPMHEGFVKVFFFLLESKGLDARGQWVKRMLIQKTRRSTQLTVIVHRG